MVQKGEVSKGKILVVDDSLFITRIFQRHLTLEGFEVTIAESGVEALKKLKNELFDVIFLDIAMSDMDGVETLKAIKKINQQTPIVMMTGRAVEKKIEEARRLGACGHIHKPFGLAQLKTLVRKVLKQASDIYE